MSLECFKEAPCAVKTSYALIAILFVMNIATYIMGCNSEEKLNAKFAKYLDENPEAILQSVNNYIVKQQQEIQQQQQAAQSPENIEKYQNELNDTKFAGVMNPKGKRTIVIFYDYNCGYCKVASKNIDELLKNRKDVKVILRSIPILSEASRYASEVGMAILIDNPSKYPDYHRALMNSSARTKQDVAKAVDSIGLSMNKIEKTLNSKKSEIDLAIESNLNLARQIGINGTPAFIINGELIPGAVDTATLDQKVGK